MQLPLAMEAATNKGKVKRVLVGWLVGAVCLKSIKEG